MILFNIGNDFPELVFGMQVAHTSAKQMLQIPCAHSLVDNPLLQGFLCYML